MPTRTIRSILPLFGLVTYPRVMIVALSTKTGEVELVARSDEFNGLASALRAGEGSIALETATDVSPYDTSLGVVVVSTAWRDDVLIEVDRDSSQLLISGSVGKMDILADNVAEMSEAALAEHLHIEHFPGHFYLNADSAPLVLRRAE